MTYGALCQRCQSWLGFAAGIFEILRQSGVMVAVCSANSSIEMRRFPGTHMRFAIALALAMCSLVGLVPSGNAEAALRTDLNGVSQRQPSLPSFGQPPSNAGRCQRESFDLLEVTVCYPVRKGQGMGALPESSSNATAPFFHSQLKSQIPELTASPRRVYEALLLIPQFSRAGPLRPPCFK